jgi:hypothetical protein
MVTYSLMRLQLGSGYRLRKLVKLATPPALLAVKEEPVLENWVHDSGRMVVIGEAAHPIPVSPRNLEFFQEPEGLLRL